MRRAPPFWWRPSATPLARVLAPAGWLYGTATAIRMARPGLTLPVPVICIGNLVAGGAGKTPTAIALATLLLEAGHRPAFLSRGYGRARASEPEPIRVDPGRHDATGVGDEPMSLAAVAPTYVAVDRIAAARCAIADGATVLLLDDGLQSPALHKTIAIAVIDGATGVGNGLSLPAGPLRAPLSRQWPFVTAVCVIGPGAAGDTVSAAAARRGLPVWRARLVPDVAGVERLRGIPLLAFAGIGRPEKFFATLREVGLDIVAARSFPDHHRFSTRDLANLRRIAGDHGAQLVTTVKDGARLPRGFLSGTLPVSLQFDEAADVSAWMQIRLHRQGMP